MKHGISEQEWVQFMDGVVDPGRRRELDGHLAGCGECRALRDDLSAWESTWLQAVMDFRRRNTITDERSRMLLDRAIVALHGTALEARVERCQWTVEQRLKFLASLLGPIYGADLVRVSLQQAALACSPGSLDGLGSRKWPAFATNLSRTFAVVCGGTAGDLVRMAAEWIPVAEA